MKKSLAILMTVVCLMFFFEDMTLHAAVGDNYCGKCGAKLVEHGENIAHWPIYHEVSIHYSDGTTKTETCYAGYSLDRTYHSCPNGHDVTWYEDKSSELHPNPICPNYSYK